MSAHPLLHDSVWLHQRKYEDAEAFYQCVVAGTSANVSSQASTGGKSSLINEITQARQQIQLALNNPGSVTMDTTRIDALERDNKELRKVTNDLRNLVIKLENRIVALEGGKPTSQSKPAPADDDDDDFDLFGGDDEDAEAELEALKQKRVADYKEKKAAKPKVIAKSNVVLDVKPWDDETDMKEVEKQVRTIEIDGLKWGASKLAPVGYGIMKLQICCIVEDDKVSIDDLVEKITDFEDLVQSVDIAAFNKV
ncbi:hypothetical protein LOTGIDRAFT_205046 [Lottia gigantea]|uniref:Translation elongation factor EF1B beta/delta subunit guanine nucleotide exchange domain-containing protein n=1 Tax=Lottia gigantea TaxID=225164 RepID=V4BBH4_LOTGI|nr:hypothetical protein LOTGIDRAFT_205046 [Lottia gigantea]ESP03397.1 hypothetical protein LOTGIDRAFT_205046 [Lottia gigantea]